MSEISSHDRSLNDLKTPLGISRRSLLRYVGIFAAGSIAGGLLTNGLFRPDQDRHLPDELSNADYRHLEEAGDIAEERAKELQARINATVYTNEPVDISVLDEILLEERVGAPVWKIDSPILLGDPPKMSDVDKGFWFGMQFPDPGGDGRSPSVGIRAVLFDRRCMALSYFFVPAGQDRLAARHLQVLVMPPDPHMPSRNIMTAYAYNEFTPDHRQHRHGDPSQPVVAPGLQIPAS